jgi:NAD(P)-dependent dehydrogenase (short-subunit alcohol dehydrogenase family)
VLSKSNSHFLCQEDAPHWTSEIKEERRNYSIEIPFMRATDPMEIANVVAFLASDESSFMISSAVMVDGGYTAI